MLCLEEKLMPKLLFIVVLVASLIAVYPAYAQEYVPKTLYIPALNYIYPIPIVEIPFKGGGWDVRMLGDYIGHLEDTGWMSSNTVLVGHIPAPGDVTPFTDLHTLNLGDIIYVYDGTLEYTFYVREIYKVDPSNVSPTAWTDDTTLTLITCSDWNGTLFTKRLIVVAKLSL
jgi:LPXTG-site transpeptidase (sortase) family protein